MTAPEVRFCHALALRSQALDRAKQTWGPAAAVSFVMSPDQTLFTVSSGEPFAPRFYGAGSTWDEAFADALLPDEVTLPLVYAVPATRPQAISASTAGPGDTGRLSPAGFGAAQPT